MRWRRLLATASLVGLLISAGVHLATFLPLRIVLPVLLALPLTLGVFPGFLGHILALHADRGLGARRSWLGSFRLSAIRDRNRRLFGWMGRWERVAMNGCMIYAILNFLVCLHLLRGGALQEEDGRYVLKQRETVVRELSDDEVPRYRRLELRLFSGHTLIFYLLPWLYFRTGRPRPYVRDDTAPPTELAPMPPTVEGPRG